MCIQAVWGAGHWGAGQQAHRRQLGGPRERREKVQEAGRCVLSALLRKCEFAAWIFASRFHIVTLSSLFENHTIPKLVSSTGFMYDVGSFNLFRKQQFEFRLRYYFEMQWCD